MEQDKNPDGTGRTDSPSPNTLDELSARVQQISVGDSASADTPEVRRFRSIPQWLQQRLMFAYPGILATAMHQYSDGDDCEKILMNLFENSSEMLAVRNADGDNPVARALLRSQEERASRLVDLAERRNSSVLSSRSQWGESLLMLSTQSSSSSSSASSDSSVMLRLLTRDPTQLHRLYDDDGRNFLHHCTMEESIDALTNALEVMLQLIEQGKLAASQVSAAIHMNDRSGSTPMHMMAYHNRQDMLSRLLEFGRRAGICINLDEQEHRGRRWTPLMVAVSRNAVEAAEFLLDNGADPCYVLDTEDRSAEYMAAVSGNDRMRWLFGEPDVSTQPVEVGAAARVKEEQVEETSWMTKGESDGGGAIDSGLASFVDTEQEKWKSLLQDPKPGFSRKEIKSIEMGLLRAGKESAFVEAFRATHSTIAMLSQMSEKPVESLISQLAHNNQCRRLVRDVLQNIGEPNLLPDIRDD